MVAGNDNIGNKASITITAPDVDDVGNGAWKTANKDSHRRNSKQVKVTFKWSTALTAAASSHWHCQGCS